MSTMRLYRLLPTLTFIVAFSSCSDTGLGPSETVEYEPAAEGIAFIIGPQVPLGESPWPYFDTNMEAKASVHSSAYLDALAAGTGATEIDYYDLGLALYTLAERSGADVHRTMAREVVSARWADLPRAVAWEAYRSPWAMTPRSSALASLIIYALETNGGPTLNFEHGPESDREIIPMDVWEWVTGYTRHHYQQWLGARLSYPELYFGVRDGGYMLLYTAQLAQVHPDTAVRAEMKEKGLAAARDYYARLQAADGGWYWRDGSDPWEQPFMVGLLLDGMIAVHQLTGDASVRDAILKSVNHLYESYRVDDMVPERPDLTWRSVPYFVKPDGSTHAETNLADGWDTNTIREGRQRNTLIVHAYGYAYKLTGDQRFLTMGDEIFASSYGKGQGPGADASYSLADFRGKEYNQAYRSAGRYLAWRLGR